MTSRLFVTWEPNIKADNIFKFLKQILNFGNFSILTFNWNNNLLYIFDNY